MEETDKRITRVAMEGLAASGAAYVVISGRIGIEEANELQRRFDEIFKTGRPWVILSLRDVEFMCSAAMGTLLAGVGEARKGGGEIVFTEISNKAKTILEFLDVWDYITTAPDKVTAEAMVQAGKKMPSRGAAKGGELGLVPTEIRSRLEEGVRLSKEGKLKDALACFNAVLKADKDNVVALTWKANALERLGQYSEAYRLYLRVNDLERGAPQLVAYARERVAVINRRREMADEDKTSRQALRSSALAASIRKAADADFLKPERTVGVAAEPALECYRTWCDGPPFGDGAPELALGRGGGYYLWLGGRGVVLDPGNNFLLHFATAGRRLADIDAVFITNVAWDHGADLEPLLETIARYNALKLGPAKKIEIYVSTAVYKKQSSLVGQAREAVSRMAMLHPGQGFEFGGARCDVKRTGAGDGPADDAAVGLIFQHGQSRLAYVGDAAAGESEVLAAQYGAARGQVLLVHVGGVYPDDDPRAQWEQNHLGFENVAALVVEVRPAVVLLGEMLNVADPVGLASTIHRTARIPCLPVDVGLKVSLTSRMVAAAGGGVAPGEIDVSLPQNGRLKYTPRSS